MVNIEISSSHGKAWPWYILVAVVVTLSSRTSAQGIAAGARVAALGCAMTAAHHNAWAPHSNPALCEAGSPVLGLAHAPAPFGLSELATSALTAGAPFSIGDVAVTATCRGFDLYRNETAEITWAGTATARVRLGVTASMDWTQIRGYGAAGAFCLDAGIAVDVADGLTVGASAFNVNQPAIGDPQRERLPMMLAAGMAWEDAENVGVYLDVSKDVRYPFNARLGVEYTPERMVALRIGATSDPVILSAGAGFRFHGFCLDYAYLGHADLGGSHSFSLDVSFSQLGL